MKPTFGLTYDLRTDYLALGYSEEAAAEFDAPETIEALEGAIRAMGFAVERIGNAPALAARLVAGDRWDVVFNIAEGLKGRSREAQVPALLEIFDVPYTMSDPLVCAATLDKGIAKRLVASAGVATAPFRVVETCDDAAGVDLEYPLFAKPLAEGTGKGITELSRIDTPERLREVCARLLDEFEQPVLVEEFLPGREFTVGVVGNGRAAEVVGTVEVNVASGDPNGIYSFHSKKHYDELVRYAPPASGTLRDAVEDLALRSYRALECRDTGRVDVRLDRQERPAFIEINPLPGLHPIDSDLPIIARLHGMTYNELIGRIIASALGRLGIRHDR